VDEAAELFMEDPLLEQRQAEDVRKPRRQVIEPVFPFRPPPAVRLDARPEAPRHDEQDHAEQGPHDDGRGGLQVPHDVSADRFHYAASPERLFIACQY